MGRLASSPPSDHRVAGFMLLSVVGTGPPHHAIREDAVSPSQLRDPSCGTFNRHDLGFTASRVPATGPQGSRAVRPCSEALLLVLVMLLGPRSACPTGRR